jgi:hypothetical protein
MIDPALHAVARVGLAVLFGSAALHKLRDLHAFRVTLGDYQLVPWVLTGVAAPGLVAAEAGTSLALLVLGGRPGPFVAAAGLLAVYTLAIAINLARGRRDIDCGCHGPALHVELGGGLVARNLAVLALAGLGLLPVTPRPLAALDAVTVAGAVAVGAAAWTAAGRLLAHASEPSGLGSQP